MKHLTGKSSIRPFVISVLALISILLVAGCGDEDGTSTAVTGDTGGRVQLTETYYDFGRVPVDTTVEHTFEIRNTGNGPLHLQQPTVKLLEGC